MKRLAQGLCLLVLACFGAVRTQARDQDHRFTTPFRHVVVIFQDNRTPRSPAQIRPLRGAAHEDRSASDRGWTGQVGRR
jgi:hypothetical protein